MNDSTKVEISVKTILITIAALLGIALAYYILDVLIMLFIVVVLTAALEPVVTKMAFWGIPRAISILLIYLIIFSVIAMAIYLLVPALAAQFKELANNLPEYIDKFTHSSTLQNFGATQKILDSISQSLNKLTGSFLSAVFVLFGGIISTLTVLAITFYILLEERGIRNMAMKLVPTKNKAKGAEIIHDMTVKLGKWLRGQVALMIIVGLAVALVLQLLGAPYALALGLIAGLLELVPIIGPIIGGAVAVLICFASGSPLWMLIAVVVSYIAIQQLESQILTPKIMQKAVGVSPVIVIVAIMIGGKLLGVGGAVLAIPMVGILTVISEEIFRNDKTDVTE